MEVCAKRGFELIEQMAFERVSGTAEEKRAADMLYEAARATGAECELDPFEVEDGVIHRATLQVLEPYQKEYEVNGYLRSDSTGADGLTAELVYVENALPVNLKDVRGKVVLINGGLVKNVYEKLMDAGVAGVITGTGSLLDRDEDSDLSICKLRPMLTEPHGFTVAVNLRVRDAVDMVRNHASKVRIVVDSERLNRTSHNVYATVRGTEKPEEIIALGAHYDSVFFSTGVYDNAAGSAILMELLRHYAAHPPRRTMKFMWFGSEEQGLFGSKHYVGTHDEEIARTPLMINVDVGAAVMGHEVIAVTGEESARAYIDGMMREAGLAAEVKQDIYSSDSIPFADHGVPGINFSRPGAPGAAFIHNRHDTLAFLSAEALNRTLETVALFTERVVNAHTLPVNRVIPAEIQEKVDKYLFRKK